MIVIPTHFFFKTNHLLTFLKLGLSSWDPDDGDDTKDVIIKWLGLIGDLFIRALSKFG
jgi:hypothetical protein